MAKPIIVSSIQFYQKDNLDRYYCKDCGDAILEKDKKAKLVGKDMAQMKLRFRKESSGFKCGKCGRKFVRSGNLIITEVKTKIV